MADGQQQGGANSGDTGIWLFVTAMVVLWVILTFKIELFATPIANVRIFELSLFLQIPFLPDNMRLELEHYLSILEVVKANPSQVDSNKLFILNDLAARYTSYIFILGMLFFCYKVYFLKKFNTVHSMDTLLKSQGDYWGRAAMFITNKVDTKDIYGGDWAISVKPHHYAMKHKFWNRENGDFFPDRAKDVFIKQLGKPLSKDDEIKDVKKIVKRWSPFARHVFAVLICRLQVNAISNAKLMILKGHNEITISDADKEKYKKLSNEDTGSYSARAEYLIKKLGRAYAYEDFDEVNKLADDIIESFANTEVVIELANKHNYYYTYFAGMLDTCRKVGVLASADFLWTKKFDRRLWYTLNNVGRRVGWAEVSGIWSHYLAEKATGTKLVEPHVDGAVEAFKVYLTPKE